MTRWSVTDYIAKLPDMPLAELCARLRGEYNDASYGKHPLHAEAARRLEAMQAEIDRLKAHLGLWLGGWNDGVADD